MPRSRARVSPEVEASLPFTGKSRAFRTLGEFDRLVDSAVETGKVDPLWRKVVAAGRMPLIFGDETAVFLYRGTAGKVAARGDFNLPYSRLAESDLWMGRRRFEPDARVEYRIRIDSRRWIQDPLNPLTETRGWGTNSVVRMPRYVAPEFALPRSGIKHGALSENLLFYSEALGYDVNYRVYTPSGFRRRKNLPVIYVVDGQDFADPSMGAMVNVLDNLIAAGRIRPVMAVFVDPRDPFTGENRREEEFVRDALDDNPLGDFIAGELVPAVDGAFPTEPSPDARAILGFSFGGAFASHMGLAFSDVFHLVGIQSPYIIRKWILETYREADRLPFRAFISHGTYDGGATSIRLRNILRDKGYPLLYVQTHEGHSFGNVRSLLDDVLVYFFGAHRSGGRVARVGCGPSGAKR
jgi:enterochelin esterase family protein